MPETNGDEDDAGAPVARRHVPALEPVHGLHPPVEPLGVRFRGRHHASFDHRDALADFQLADPARVTVATMPARIPPAIAVIGMRNGPNDQKPSMPPPQEYVRTRLFSILHLIGD